MKKFLQLLLVCGLIPALAVPVSAAETGSHQSEEGQAMIGPSISHTEKSSGMDWGAANNAASPAAGDGDFTVVIDPGHQGPSVDMSASEPMAPGSSQTKPKATSGTQGNFSGVPEYELNLQVSVLLQEELVNRGYHVVMTRTDNETAISNSERAILATEQNADITVRIHANSDGSSSASGALTMAPTSANQYLSSEIIEKSNTLASCIISHYCTSTGLENRGVISSDNMTGTNWSTVPVAILEMGFMSNQSDDLYITNSANHPIMVSGIADGIDEYFSIVEPQTAGEGEHLSDLTEQLKKDYTDKLKKEGENWSIAVMDPVTDDYSTIRADDSMESAGLIKTFIMGAVFEYLVYPDAAETPSSDYETDLKPLLVRMIADNDNFSADDLVKLLGNGDFENGAAVVNEFCKNHGFSYTKMGTELLEKDSTANNFTSASDCCRILTEIYKGNLVNQKASEEMLNLLKQQNLKDKIPSGLPNGIETASKTGEMTEDQNPVLIENDIAIVLDSNRPYVICILSNCIKKNEQAQKTISQISSDVYQYMSSSDHN